MQTTIMFKTDKRLKEAVQKTAKKMGLPFSTLVNQALKDIVNREQITFSAREYNPTPYLRRILDREEKDFKTGKNIKTFNSVEALIADLEK